MKISKFQINIYIKYYGDIDGLARVGTAFEKQSIDAHVWNEISGFYSQIVQMETGKLSVQEEADLKVLISNRFEDISCIDLLSEMKLLPELPHYTEYLKNIKKK